MIYKVIERTKPIRATKNLKEPPGRLRFLSLEEIRKLLACCPLIILPITKNNTVRLISINDTLFRILSEIPEKIGYVFGNGNSGHIGDIRHSFTSACSKRGITGYRFHNLRQSIPPTWR